MENRLRDQIYQCLIDLSHEEGINASAKNEIFGCIFGRDSALTILKILKANSKLRNENLLVICKRALLTLVNLQGKQFNIESGEEPGKFIHEFRRDNYQHLIQKAKPWFLYPDNLIRNYDSLDSTPLILIAIYKYWEQTEDEQFLQAVLPAVEAGLNWAISFGDQDKDVLVEYSLHAKRKSGGLHVQSWTDSYESLLNKRGKFPKYPIAPIEVQGYIWLTLKLWGDFYGFKGHRDFSVKLSSQADKLKEVFNQKFIIKSDGLYFGAQALDGDKRRIKTITSNPLLLLWSSYQYKGKMESIIDEKYILDFVRRGFKADLFDKDAGLRTMSSKSATFNPNQDSYHNGSFWPILNGLIYEGLINWNFLDKAILLREASLKPISYFQTPIELYIKDQNGNYLEYKSPSGQISCKTQAWSAAALLDFLTP